MEIDSILNQPKEKKENEDSFKKDYQLDIKFNEDVDLKSPTRKEVYKRIIEITKEQYPQAFALIKKYNPDILKRLGIGMLNDKIRTKIEYEFSTKIIKKYGVHYFYKRVIIPYNDEYFVGRTLNKNTKKKNLFPPKVRKPLWYIQSEQEKPEGLILVEGETDAIAATHIFPQYDIICLGGVKGNIVNELHSYLRTDNILICFDNDSPGREGKNKIAKLIKEDLKLEPKEIDWNEDQKDIDEIWHKYQLQSINHLHIKDYAIKDIFIEEEYEIITKKEYLEIIEENFPGLGDTVSVCLSVICINKLKEWTDPVNINLVGPPSSQKTTAASFFYGIEGLTYKSDSFTPKSFVSHSCTVTKEELDEIDLLPKIKDKCFITPELGPLFGKRKEDLTELIGILTRVFDGEGLETDSGSMGHRGYSGEYLFTMIGATTPLPKTAWNIMSKMGSRMFFYNVPDESIEDEYLMNMIMNDKTYGRKLKLCKKATKCVLQGIFKEGTKRDVEWDNSKNEIDAANIIINCARTMCKLRASIQVWEDDYTNNVIFESPQIEKPMRIVNILFNIAKGHAITENRNYITMGDIWMIPIVTASTMPEDRIGLFKIILNDINGSYNIKKISKEMNCSEKITRKSLKTFEVLGILDKFELGSSHEIYYQLNTEFKNWVEKGILALPVFTSGSSSLFNPSVRDLERKIYKNIRNTRIPLVKSGKANEEIIKKSPILPNFVNVNQDIVLKIIGTQGIVYYEEILEKTGMEESELNGILDKLKQKGEIFEKSPSKYVLLS